MVERTQEKRAKPPFAAVRRSQAAGGQHLGQEFLGQVLRVMHRIAAPPDIRVKRIPVRLKQLLQRLDRSG
jgi:hypothetical protein